MRKSGLNLKLCRSIFIAFTFLATSSVISAIPAQAISTDAVVVDVDFTSATVSSTMITNNAVNKIQDLTSFGVAEGAIDTTSGLTFGNTSDSTSQYLTGNIGTTTNISKVVVEMTALFPDAGCEVQSSGSMVLGFGDSNSYVPYNIYRHSNFIGFNTFQSEIYGIEIPNTTMYHAYKFVMVEQATGFALQEMYVDGVSQVLTYKTAFDQANGCTDLDGTAEINSNRLFADADYNNGNFTFMTHPLDVDFWKTTGSIKSLKITTTTPSSTTTPTPAVTNLDSIVEGTDLALALNLDLNARLTSGLSRLTGSGLKPSSEYKLFLQSDPVLLYTGTTDVNGDFSSSYNFRTVACPGVGVHTLTLVGTRPNGTQTKAVVKMILDSSCSVKALVQGGLVKKMVFDPILFKYQSDKLTKKAKKNLKVIVPLLMDAKVIKIYGYTQTNNKSSAVKKANKVLAKERAISVRKYLKKQGVTATIKVIGKGGVKPVSLKQQRLNRRVSISVGYAAA